MSEPSQLDALIARLADGDRAAFTPAFRILWPRVYGLCLSLLAKAEDAEDAAQQALEKILTRASDYDRSRPALPWALAIAGWECRTITTRRARKREVGAEGLSELEGGANAEETFIHQELIQAVRGVLSELSPRDHTLLVECYWREAEGAASPALRKRRQRALERLRAAFRRLYEPE